jgi:hypothetical protein
MTAGKFRVERTREGYLRVDDRWFTVQSVADAAYRRLEEAGSSNPAFDAPPFCFTGCPYADAILALGLPYTLTPPESATVEYVPHDGKKPWRAREPIWPAVFGVDATLYER